MEPIYDKNGMQLFLGDALAVLKQLPDESVHCCCTSPPYFGLRNYQTGFWEGGTDPECKHKKAQLRRGINLAKSAASTRGGAKKIAEAGWIQQTHSCPHCGAIRHDQQIGLESSPEEYISKLVEVFREVRRVMRSDATCWVNIGDSFWGGKGQSGSGGKEYQQMRSEQGVSFSSPEAHVGGPGKTRPQDGKHSTIKPKDMVGIPWMLAFALRADGWYLRSECIWSKMNCMPESVTDRPTKSHEQVFLLTKRPRYFFDQEAIKTPAKSSTIQRAESGTWHNMEERPNNGFPGQSNRSKAAINRDIRELVLSGAEIKVNPRSVWEIPTESFGEAHYAVFPQALARRCILAGTSERGCCSACSAPWKRIIEQQRAPRGDAFGKKEVGDFDHGQQGSPYQQIISTTTIGWEPSCKCNAGPPQSCTVLDPFAGAATSGVVCLKTGRNFIGIELSENYIREIAIPRLDEVASRVIPSLPFEEER